jgi:hypothetical protein
VRLALNPQRLPLWLQLKLGRFWVRHVAPRPGPQDIRKYIHELSAQDLEQCPVWEFCTDEEGQHSPYLDSYVDEETVRPRPDLARVDPADGIFVVASAFEAADGTRYAGFAQASHANRELALRGLGSEHEYAAPTIITERGHVSFVLPTVRTHKQEARLRPAADEVYRTLGTSAPELFPLRWQMTVPADSGMTHGELPGFHYERETPERGADGKRRWRSAEEWMT